MSEAAGSYNLDNMTVDQTTTNDQDAGQTRTDKQDSTGPARPGQERPPDTTTKPERDDRQTDRPTDDRTDRQTDKDTDRDTDRQPDRRTDRRTDGQTEGRTTQDGTDKRQQASRQVGR